MREPSGGLRLRHADRQQSVCRGSRRRHRRCYLRPPPAKSGHGLPLARQHHPRRAGAGYPICQRKYRRRLGPPVRLPHVHAHHQQPPDLLREQGHREWPGLPPGHLRSDREHHRRRRSFCRLLRHAEKPAPLRRRHHRLRQCRRPGRPSQRRDRDPRLSGVSQSHPRQTQHQDRTGHLAPRQHGGRSGRILRRHADHPPQLRGYRDSGRPLCRRPGGQYGQCCSDCGPFLRGLLPVRRRQ